MKPLLLLFIGAAILLALPSWKGDASADRTFRCRGGIVSLGAIKDQVLEKCGRPDRMESWETSHDTVAVYSGPITERFRRPRLFIGPIHFGRWTYDLGSNRFLRHLLFREGELIEIKTGDKGRK